MSDATIEIETLRSTEDFESDDSIVTSDASQDVSNYSEPTSEEVGKTFSEELDDAGVTDTTLAFGIAQIMSKSTKTISIGGGDTIEVPDYTNRLAAMKLAMQAKGHLSEKTQGLEKAKKHIDYILK